MCEEIFTDTYRRLAAVPDLKAGYIVRKNGQGYVVESEWSQRNLVTWQRTVSSCLQEVTQDTDTTGGVFSAPRYTPLIDNCQLTGRSGDCTVRLIQGTATEGKELRYLMVSTDASHSPHFVPLADSKLHGKVYSDVELGCMSISADQSSVAFVAEEYRPKPTSFLAPLNPDKPEDDGRGQQFEWRADFGEQLSGQSKNVVVVVPCAAGPDDSGRVALTPPPEYSGVGQLLWAGPRTLVGVAYIDASPRLGLIYCKIREAVLFSVSLDDKKFTELTPRGWWVGSPRLSPDGKQLVYLRGPVGGPHIREAQLVVMGMEDCSQTRVVVDYQEAPIDLPSNGGLFSGLTGASVLPLRCFLSDSYMVFSAHTQFCVDAFLLNLETGALVNLTEKSTGNSVVQDVLDGRVLYSRSSFSVPPLICFTAVDLPQGDATITSVSRFNPKLDSSSKLIFDHAQWTAESGHYSALYCAPPRGSQTDLRPVILYCHGGPHSMITNAYTLNVAMFVTLGYSVVMPNFRGSLGRGKRFIHELPGRAGDIDVQDCHNALLDCLDRYKGEVDPENVFLFGGSHGGFLVTHLSAKYPDFYRAVCCRNPVTDIATLAGVSDIPDWSHCEAGTGDADSAGDPPSLEALTAMRACSPLWNIDRVKAPTLLQLGTGDRRVPPSQGIKYHEMLKRRGIPTSINLYDDCHPLSKVDHEADGMLHTLVWFKRYARAAQKLL